MIAGTAASHFLSVSEIKNIPAAADKIKKETNGARILASQSPSLHNEFFKIHQLKKENTAIAEITAILKFFFLDIEVK